MTAAQGGRSLAAQTARTLAIAFGVFIVIAVAGIIWFMMVPMARRSAEDLAALMMLVGADLDRTAAADPVRFRG